MLDNHDLVKLAEAIRARMFPHFESDRIYVEVEDGIVVLNFGDYVLQSPESADCWDVATFRWIPGSFSPFEGGYPPDVEDVSIATKVQGIVEAFAVVINYSQRQKLDDIYDGVMEQLSHGNKGL